MKFVLPNRHPKFGKGEGVSGGWDNVPTSGLFFVVDGFPVPDLPFPLKLSLKISG